MYDLAFEGNFTRMKEVQAETGVKDRIAEHWFAKIQDFVQEQRKIRITNKLTKDKRLRASKTSKEQRALIRQELKAQIAVEAREWLHMQPPHLYAALPEGSRKFIGESSC